MVRSPMRLPPPSGSRGSTGLSQSDFTGLGLGSDVGGGMRSGFRVSVHFLNNVTLPRVPSGVAQAPHLSMRTRFSGAAGSCRKKSFFFPLQKGHSANGIANRKKIIDTKRIAVLIRRSLKGPDRSPMPPLV